MCSSDPWNTFQLCVCHSKYSVSASRRVGTRGSCGSPSPVLLLSQLNQWFANPRIFLARFWWFQCSEQNIVLKWVISQSGVSQLPKNFSLSSSQRGWNDDEQTSLPVEINLIGTTGWIGVNSLFALTCFLPLIDANFNTVESISALPAHLSGGAYILKVSFKASRVIPACLTLLRHAASIKVPERTQQVDYGWCQVHGGVGRTCRVLCRCPEPSAESSRIELSRALEWYVKAAGVRANARGYCCCWWWSLSRAADARVSARFVSEKWDWKTV